MINKFIGYNRGFDIMKGFAPEFCFKDYDELISNTHISTIAGTTNELKMLRQKRAWLGSDGKVSKTFYSVMLESNKGDSWVMLGRCEEDVPQLKDWGK